MLDKHAYLIICHTNFTQLNILLDLLDDERNDIFLHINKRASYFSIDCIKSHSVNSKLFLIKPIRVSWGGDSLIKVTVKLLTEATKTPHAYYHLLSGMDLPLKTQDEIHSFFSQNFGLDYVALEKTHSHNISITYLDRVNYYYFFQNYISPGKSSFLSKLQNKFINIQKRLKVNRTKNYPITFQKGSEWFSISHETACYVLKEYRKYKKYFRYSFCGDELFIQTILINSPKIHKVIDDNLRYIDWNRGSPYIFRQKDYDLLIHSDKLFARKFDITIDKNIILKIHNFLLNKTD